MTVLGIGQRTSLSIAEFVPAVLIAFVGMMDSIEYLEAKREKNEKNEWYSMHVDKEIDFYSA